MKMLAGAPHARLCITKLHCTLAMSQTVEVSSAVVCCAAADLATTEQSTGLRCRFPGEVDAPASHHGDTVVCNIPPNVWYM